jgi:LPS sulfotransferase NodH
LRYDFDKLLAHYDRIIRGDKLWADYFHAAGVQPFEVAYEDFAANKAQVVLALLGKRPGTAY